MTRAGRNVVIRNSVLALAWYLCEHQPLPNLESMMNTWREDVWDFIARGAIAAANGTRRGHTNVKHTTLVQDYKNMARVRLMWNCSRGASILGKCAAWSNPLKDTHSTFLISGSINITATCAKAQCLLMSSCDFLKLTHADTPPLLARRPKTIWGHARLPTAPRRRDYTGHTLADPRTPRDLPREGWSLGVLMEPYITTHTSRANGAGHFQTHLNTRSVIVMPALPATSSVPRSHALSPPTPTTTVPNGSQPRAPPTCSTCYRDGARMKLCA